MAVNSVFSKISICIVLIGLTVEVIPWPVNYYQGVYVPYSESELGDPGGNVYGNDEVVELVPLVRTRRAIQAHETPVTPVLVEKEPPRRMRFRAPLRHLERVPHVSTEMEASNMKVDPMVASGTDSYGHSHHPYDYVDYGAYTGGYGAFGWYTDHPVYVYGHHGHH